MRLPQKRGRISYTLYAINSVELLAIFVIDLLGVDGWVVIGSRMILEMENSRMYYFTSQGSTKFYGISP